MPTVGLRFPGAGRAFWGALVGMALFPASVPLAAQGPIEPASRECSRINLIQTATVGQYVFKAYKDKVNGNGCMEVQEVRRQGKIIGKLIPRVVFRKTLEGMGAPGAWQGTLPLGFLRSAQDQPVLAGS